MSTQTALLKVMSDAARKAARGLNRDFGELSELQVSRKAPADFVSAADLRAEQTIFEALEKARPGYSFMGEERGLIEGTDKTHTWIVDPLDGTTNFLHAIPHFAINIALQREGVVVAAVTYNPVTNELFWAEKGKGCFVNDKRLRVAGRKHLDEAVLGTGIPFLGHGQHARFLKELHQISQRVAGVRRFGAAALDLAYVAAGRLDGFWERDLKAWDMAAGMLLISEAGGKVTDAEGGDDIVGSGSICAANLELHPLLIEKLKAAA
ncbi:inositol monophosphatase [Phenylobacterium sp. Root77]|uniref:inositol monophosphatase family protein n=1 Tax=unclassified Phenylobacterium TaxID=2640670 RepID=UPI0006F88FFF|nr:MULTISPECIES: inositol monophosphatase family protein [unclassified Phenylobacterium]KQW73449.1 inositol monophosphatase [Phenylobacterium sp. Root1277]KQW92668.1 inositol monophosphatase [Phenylobacterium sp. Root1290]KRC40895.1 inositol monophosphatase [Phenylobacterium sp. Root77]